MRASSQILLLVDDGAASAITAALLPLGQTLVRARSSGDALARAATGDISLVIADADLPSSMTGSGRDIFETVVQLRRNSSARMLQVPVLFLVQRGDRGHAARGYALGAIDCLDKPFDVDVLRAKASAVIALYRRKDESAAAAANRAKDELLALVSHELRQPLSAIMGWAELMHSGRLDGPRTQKAIETILRNARSQRRLIEDLLDITRIDSGKLALHPRAVDVDAVVHAAAETVRPLAAQRQVTVEVDAPPGDWKTSADPDRLQQVVWNLLANAVKFSSSGMTVELQLRRSGGVMEIAVRDGGIGIAPEFLPHVFDKFRQASSSGQREGGLGLGLAIARHLVELHGGAIDAESAGLGKGATFTVRLPVRPAHPSGFSTEVEFSQRVTVQRLLPSPPEQKRVAGLRVLVVDDAADVCELVSTVLEEAGMRVTTAESAGEAMQHLRAQRFDVLVCDLAMPVEDGCVLVRRARALLRAHGVYMPAIALSACAGDEDREQALEAGFQTCLAKPFDPPYLVSLIAGIVDHDAIA